MHPRPRPARRRFGPAEFWAPQKRVCGGVRRPGCRAGECRPRRGSRGPALSGVGAQGAAAGRGERGWERPLGADSGPHGERRRSERGAEVFPSPRRGVAELRAPTLLGLWAVTSRARHLGGGAGPGCKGRPRGEGCRRPPPHATLPPATRPRCGRSPGEVARALVSPEGGASSAGPGVTRC